MGKRSIALFASDFLDSKLALGLAQTLEGDFSCRVFAGEGRIPAPFSESDVQSAVKTSDLVVLSSSEYCVPEVWAAKRAVELDRPIALMALFYNQLQKKEYEPFRLYICLVFVLDDAEALAAKELYPNASIVVAGNPEWETFSFPSRTRAEVRSILNIAPNEKFILISGEKEAGVNFPLAVNVIEAVANLPDLESFKIIFTIHPGHVPLPGGASLLEFYQELQGYNPKVSIVPSCKATPFGIGTPDMVPGADLVIGTNSTVQIQAAFLGIPAIAVLLRRAFRGIELPQEPRGWWPPCDRGAIAPVYGVSSDETARLIATLLTAEGSAPMRAAQKRFFPPFKKVGQAFERMGEAIRNLEPLNA